MQSSRPLINVTKSLVRKKKLVEGTINEMYAAFKAKVMATLQQDSHIRHVDLKLHRGISNYPVILLSQLAILVYS